MENTLSVQDLLNIYNKYAPEPLTIQEVQRYSNSDVNVAKTELIARFLAAARDGQLLRGKGFGNNKVGMKELQHIILDLQRDVKRVKNAISPQGAEALVARHNATNPHSPWKLNKRNPNAPASLQNLTDVNNDGIPDVIISNHNDYPMYVNGYTTKTSNYPVALHYYDQYPTRESRKNYPLNAFKQDLLNISYVDSGNNYNDYGNISYEAPESFQGYNLSGYKVKPSKRMSAYQRFRKFVIGPYVDNVIAQIARNNNTFIPKKYKLQFLASASARIWELYLAEAFYNRLGAQTKDAKDKIKKENKGSIDGLVTNCISAIHNNDRQFIEQIFNNIASTLIQVVAEFRQANPNIDLRALFINEQNVHQQRMAAGQALNDEE